ncbi:MAG: glycogen synthase GlgA [Collinsella sp.]|nr:glycogen synthase GlgA [Collinsella sp.]
MAESTRRMGVVFASAEAAPFVKTGGLGDVAGSLPHALAAAGVDTVVMVPNYATIAEEYRREMEHVTSFQVPLGWRSEYCGIERLARDGMTYLFLDNERYFARDYPYGFFDDGERFAFFAKAVVESLQHLAPHFTCDILHANDWHTALSPVFLREFYRGIPLYDNVRTVFSIHNIAFQGQFSDTVLSDILGLAHVPAAAHQLRADATSVNYMLGALNYADAITTVSPTYAEEIKTAAFGEGLDGVLRRRGGALQGIVNGIDCAHFDPASDPAIPARFTADDLSGKAACKAALQEELGLEVRDDRPLMTMVTRLTRQKGLDLVTYALDRILSGGVQVAVLGTGDAAYENALRYFEGKYPGQMAARIQFDPALSQRMYAGSDLFLMPSLFEPCGLSQMIAMRYGTLPVVRETGGLKDTVVPYNYETGEGTGFSFANFNGEELGDAVFRAARLFWDDRAAFTRVIRQAMAQDFSWTVSAERYLDLYFWLHPEIERGGGAASSGTAESSGGTAPAEASPKPKRAARAKRAAAPDSAPAPEEASAPAPKRAPRKTKKVAAGGTTATDNGAAAAEAPQKPKRTARTAKPSGTASGADPEPQPKRSVRAKKAAAEDAPAPAATKTTAARRTKTAKATPSSAADGVKAAGPDGVTRTAATAARGTISRAKAAGSASKAETSKAPAPADAKHAAPAARRVRTAKAKPAATGKAPAAADASADAAAPSDPASSAAAPKADAANAPGTSSPKARAARKTPSRRKK